MIDNKKKIIGYNVPIDYETVCESLQFFSEKYDIISIGSIGKSIFGKQIPIIKLGNGIKKVMYIGAHHGSEWITCGILLRFINEYCELYKCRGRVGKTELRELFESVEINLVPMLNPDGVDISIHGVKEENIMCNRLMSMNNESSDFSCWNSNGRGVDLNHNYNYGFEEYKVLEAKEGIACGAPTRYSGEYPESEPETGYLCNYLRFCNGMSGVLTFHSQGEEIFYKSGEYFPDGADEIAGYFSKISGYKAGQADGLAAYGGFSDWFIREFERPSFTIECGKGNNPLPIDKLPMIYIGLRQLLFEAPLILARRYPQKG